MESDMRQNSYKPVFTFNLFTAFLILIPFLSFSQTGPVGFASLHGNTTGGKGGDTILVTSEYEFINVLITRSPRIILITDTIDLNFGESIDIDNDNISILGKDTRAMLRYGGLNLIGNNIIVQNLSIGQSYTPGHWDGKGEPRTDAITVYGKNIWIDHCDLFHSHDGLIDFSSIRNSCADYVTVSWTRFRNHNKVMLVGSNDQSTMCREQFHITVHHCWFDGASYFYDSVDQEYHRIQQRMPRVRFGDVHVFNNYYEEIADYAIAARLESKVVVEHCFFRNMEDAHIIKDQGKGIRDPELVAIENIYEHVKGNRDTAGEAFNPNEFYNYTLDETKKLPALIMNEAGKFNRSDNHDPIAINDTIIISYNTNKSIIQPLNNDSDADGDSIRISAILNSPKGNWIVFPEKIEYKQSTSKLTSDVIEYQIIDFEGGISQADIFITFTE